MGSLDSAAISDPRQVRLVFSFFENGACNLEVQECVNLGELTFEINGEPTEVVCTNIRTGLNEVVAVIESNATQKVSFELSRYLPQKFLSNLFRLIRKNCGLRVYVLRSDVCVDPLNPNDFDVIEIFGDINFGAYTRSQSIHLNKSEATQITESTTVTAYDFVQAAAQNYASRGTLHTDAIVDVARCDQKTCGGPCQDDSDGCQKWFTIDDSGVVGFTNNQFFTEGVTAAIPGWVGPASAICCSGRGKVLVWEENAGQGVLHVSTVADILDGGATTWVTHTTDINGALLDVVNDCYFDEDTGFTWAVGANAAIYQYDPSLGTITPIPGVAGIVTDFNAIDIKGDNVLIGGVSATGILSVDGGRSFIQVPIIDPATGLTLGAGISLTAAQNLAASPNNFAFGTDDDRVLYTVDGAVTWRSQLIFGQGAGVITDMVFDAHDIGWMTRNEGGNGFLYKTYFGSCEEWILQPSGSEVLPTNAGLNAVEPCPDDPSVVVAVGEAIGGAGITFVGTSEYR